MKQSYMASIRFETFVAAAAIVFLVASEAEAWRGRNPRAHFQLHVTADSDRRDEREPRSEPATMTDDGPGRIGGLGGVSVGYAPIAGDNGLLIGGEGALLLGHRFSIGGAGFGLVNGIRADTPGGDSSRIGLGYGGVILRCHMAHEYPIYPTLGALVGFGGVSFNGNGGDALMVIEPSAGFYMTITRWLRLGFSLSYKIVTGVDTPGLDDKDFRGLGFAGHIDFGAL